MTLPGRASDSEVKPREQLERLFVENLPLIDRTLGVLCTRNGYHGDDADDVCSWVKTRLIEQEYAVLAKFRGESSLASYLAVVLAMQVREYRVAQWGRWRPSAVARERGEIAVRLESLVHRDGMTVRQAAERLRTAGHTSMTVSELIRLSALLPMRPPLRARLVGTDAIEESPDGRGTDDVIDDDIVDEERRRTSDVLGDAMRSLPIEEQVMLRMRFWEGLSIADVSRGLSLPQKPLYRRLERALEDLRLSLEEAGISVEQVRRLIGASLPTSDTSVSKITESGENDGTGPSTTTSRRPTLRQVRGEPR